MKLYELEEITFPKTGLFQKFFLDKERKLGPTFVHYITAFVIYEHIFHHQPEI